jgi:hypothetical protein
MTKRKNVCNDCKKTTSDQYMIKNDLWRKHGAGHGFLHIACLEKRMDRPLTLDDLTPAPINLPLRIKMGDTTIHPDSPSMMMYRWNNAGLEKWDHTKFDLVPGTLVMARKNYDPTGAQVFKGDQGVVFGGSNVFGDDSGPIVKWFRGGICNIYPGMSEATWCSDTVWMYTRHKIVPEPEAIRALLKHSWKDVDFQYDQLTDEERAAISPEQFERVVTWLFR